MLYLVVCKQRICVNGIFSSSRWNIHIFEQFVWAALELYFYVSIHDSQNQNYFKYFIYRFTHISLVLRPRHILKASYFCPPCHTNHSSKGLSNPEKEYNF